MSAFKKWQLLASKVIRPANFKNHGSIGDLLCTYTTQQWTTATTDPIHISIDLFLYSIHS